MLLGGDGRRGAEKRGKGADRGDERAIRNESERGAVGRRKAGRQAGGKGGTGGWLGAVQR